MRIFSMILCFLVLSGQVVFAQSLPSRVVNFESVIFFNGFEHLKTGYYSETQALADWSDSLRIQSGVFEGRTSIAKDGYRKKVLQILYPTGQFGPDKSGAQWELPFFNVYEELYFSYWVKFPTDFDFVKGGKLPGFIGGEGNTNGHKPNGKDGWSVRLMWGIDGLVKAYVYHPDQVIQYGDAFSWEHAFIPGRWHHIEVGVRMNKIGQTNGIIQGWFDGQLSLNIDSIRFRDVAELGIDGFYFSTFFGGGDESWATTKREYVLFDEFVISTEPIHGFLFKE